MQTFPETIEPVHPSKRRNHWKAGVAALALIVGGTLVSACSVEEESGASDLPSAPSADVDTPDVDDYDAQRTIAEIAWNMQDATAQAGICDGIEMGVGDDFIIENVEKGAGHTYSATERRATLDVLHEECGA